ncbi:ribonuclease II [Saccharomonospora piscinae]|uniref:Ribonuclease II n=1 Tax=Saccharomonospora piscinae TaxID=687388 RepID=A0A1V8ZZK4_SACPI|nr:RNB domain-containing ribonuclease [Saccharomonospora piscinae]OQO90322.1 ribonuclease II [Saccharomonospora piscinae]TLW89738.1 RNB domain-containing ribonuclease [Saccharomonospora piscinae]
MALVAHGQGAGDFASLRAEFALPESFPPDALAEAEVVAGDPLTCPGRRRDATELPLVTVDPPGAKDLDQAMLLARRGRRGYRVYYAIADLAAFVPVGGRLDAEARRRGQTLYLPDGNVGLHPPILAEHAASLLPGVVRPAVLWTIDLDSAGEVTAVRVGRAWVRSVRRLDHDSVAAALADGTAHPSVSLLPELGRLRREHAAGRGAVEPQVPEQRVRQGPDGDWALTRRPRHAVEEWNAEISLLTGMAAAQLMIGAGVGVLRTVPEAGADAVNWLRRSARALGVDWPHSAGVAEVLAGLDPADPASLALHAGTVRLLRGAGYTAFDGDLPGEVGHAGIGSPYTHVTAPIRRLVDRFACEVCLAVADGRPVPEWVRVALPELPRLMGVSDSVAARVEKACLDQVGTWVLAGRVGGTFGAVVLRGEGPGGGAAEVFVDDPPMLTRCSGVTAPEGSRITVRLTRVDGPERKVWFEQA